MNINDAPLETSEDEARPYKRDPDMDGMATPRGPAQATSAVTDDAILAVARKHFKPNPDDTERTLTAFISCVRDVVATLFSAPRDSKQPIFYLNLKQLRMALDIFDPGPAADADDIDTEIAIQTGDGHSGKGLYAWNADYPDEGAFALFDTPEEADAGDALQSQLQQVAL